MAALEPSIDAHAARGGRRPLIAHVVFRFDYGGLENGIVNIVNGLPAQEFDHAIIALTQASEFSSRIRRPDVRVYALNKQPGKDWGAYLRLWKLLRQIRPTIVHTRNVGTLDCQLVAWLAGVPVRIHGEHGWDIHDPDGTNPKYLRVRRLFDPFVHRFVTVSRDLQEWLVQRVGIRPAKVRQICNGVDTQRFEQSASTARQRLPAEYFPPGCCIVGSVTRLTEIKDPLSLVRAWLAVRAPLAAQGHDLRLALIGDGPLRGAIEAEIREAGAERCAWLAGSRDDVADVLRSLDIFALSSLREGISNTVLEAMATGLPIIASATGGNLELIEDGVTGTLTPPGDFASLAQALRSYVQDPAKRAAHGAAARRRAERMYSLSGMMNRYRELYAMQRDKVLEAA
ncbi:MAG TPA: TIGR03088 family PEP-CTERM/XrtA system glycosyltransferase [Steroidobacteraceae bacterium]|nr:TIGR03088 family PEP-CTERM/XrtA system glycosyltransferase [Steroidobacteraceae bacterium]